MTQEFPDATPQHQDGARILQPFAFTTGTAGDYRVSPTKVNAEQEGTAGNPKEESVPEPVPSPPAEATAEQYAEQTLGETLEEQAPDSPNAPSVTSGRLKASAPKTLAERANSSSKA